MRRRAHIGLESAAVRRFLLPVVVLLLPLTGDLAGAQDAKPATGSDSGTRSPDLPQSLALTSPERKPMNFLLTQAELRDFVRDYERRTGQNLTEPLDDDEVLVTAPGPLAPMRDVSQEAWGGIAAPFWAILNPKDAWRIFLPIPPKGGQNESERPAPDPR